ncbi:MAG: hypothetical protein IJU57_07190 [Clostridia bacterium]|nr:hypothetical protein [Clostridia bacterium]
MPYLIGLDIGTSSVKGVLMTEQGIIAEKAREGFTYDRRPDGTVEIGARAYLESCVKALRALAAAAGNEKILGICASSASGNLLFADSNGRALSPIINWQDGRVRDEARRVLGDIDTGLLYRRTGWPFDFRTFPLAQLCRIREQSPGLLSGDNIICMSTEYLYHALTGRWGISASAGTPFYLIDQQTGEYIPELLASLGIRKEQLPPVLPCGSVLGEVLPGAAAEYGLPAGIPVILGSFDHPSAARGAGVLKEGEMLLSCGTSWVGFFPCRSRERLVSGGLLIDPFLAPDGCWAGMVSAASLSNNIEKYVKRYIDRSGDSYRTLSSLAAGCAAGAGGLMICPADEPDDGLTEGFSREQIARAIMEGTVRLFKDQLARAEKAGIRAERAVMVGGPSEDPLWARIIEDICGFPVRTDGDAHAGARGAAVLAGIGTGVYRDETHAQECIRRQQPEQETQNV